MPLDSRGPRPRWYAAAGIRAQCLTATLKTTPQLPTVLAWKPVLSGWKRTGET